MRIFRQPSRDPLWKEEFSIHTGEERFVQRRQFTKFLLLTSLGMFAGNLWILLRSWLYREPVHPARRVAAAGEISPGEVKLFRYPAETDPCIMVRTGQDSYVAYSQKCTHLSCAVYYSRERNRLECPCHEGYFSVEDGRVLQGPPARPLPRILIERRGEDLVATGISLGAET
jgi:nitrite reductase/ring-hydroxylating ferredoxin subunit